MIICKVHTLTAGEEKMKKNFVLLLIILICVFTSSTFISTANEVGKSKLVYFYSPYCNSCQQAEPYLLEIAKELSVTVEKFNIQDPGSVSLMLELLIDIDKAPSTAGQVPAFFIADRVIIGFSSQVELREFIIGVEMGTNKDANKISAVGIFLAGLADGINPCTLNVLLILLAIILRKSKMILVKTGISFVLGVVTVYFFIGIGMGVLVERLTILRAVAPYLYIVLGTSILFGLVFDNRNLTHKAKTKLGSLIGKLRDRGLSTPTVYLMGLCSSLFEFLCTGQVYLPTVYYISTQNSFGYLLGLIIYNTAFAIPMLLIIGIMHFGKNAIRVQGLLKNKNVTIFNKVVLVMLGIYLLSIGLKSLFFKFL